MNTLLLLLALAKPGQDPAFESYRAHIAAASAALESGDIKRTLAWLERAPQKFRNWEWDYLANQCDTSVATAQPFQGTLTKIQVSPDGNSVAVAGADGKVRILDPGSLRTKATLEGHTAAVFGLFYSTDGTRLVTTSRDNTIRLWDTGSNRLIGTLGEHPVTPYNAKFSPDGTKVVSVGWRMHPEKKSPVGLIRVWDVATKKLLCDLDYTTHPISSLDFSSDGKHCYIGCWEAQVLDFNLETFKVEREITPPPDGGYQAVDWVELDPTGSTLAVATKDKLVNLFDVATGSLKRSLPHRGYVTSNRFTADGQYIVSSALDNTVRVWKGDGAPVATLKGHLAPVYCVAVSPNGQKAYSCDQTGIVKAWDTSRPFQYAPTVTTETGWSCRPDPTGSMIAVGSNGNNIQVFRLADGKLVRTIGQFGNLVVDAAWSPNGERIVGGSNDGTFRAFEVASGKELWKHTDRGQVRSAAYSPDGRFVACGYGTSGKAYVLNAETGQVLYQADMTPGILNAAFSPRSDKAYFAAAKTVLAVDAKTWQAKTLNQELASPAMSLEVSPDGGLLVTGEENGTVQAIDARSGKAVWTSKTDGTQWGATFSPDGSRIATAGYDFALHLWDTKTGSEVFALRDLPFLAFDTHFTPDGDKLVFMGGSSTIVWLDRRPFRTILGLQK